MYVLMKGLKLLNGTSNVDMFNFRDSFAFLSVASLPVISTAERRGLAFVYSLPGTLFSKPLSFRLHKLPHYTFKVLPCQ